MNTQIKILENMTIEKINGQIFFLNNISILECINEKIHIIYRKKIKIQKLNTNINETDFNNIYKNDKNKIFLKLGKYYFNKFKILLIQEKAEKLYPEELNDIILKKDQHIYRFIFELDYFDVVLGEDFWNLWKQIHNI